ncbi:MAG: cell division protein FtsA, partial [Bacteroidota bacterium]
TMGWQFLHQNSDEEIASPLYATAVGLLMNAIESQKKNMSAMDESMEEEQVLVEQEVSDMQTSGGYNKERKSIFDKWSEKLKDFLDNAE